MDALVALRDDGAHAEELRPLRRPVARRARAVLLPGEDDERRAFRAIALGRLEDRHLLARGHVHRPGSLGARDELVAEADVRERAAHHHLVVPSARAVRVEVLALDAVLDEVAAGRRVGLDRAGGRDVVGRHGVADRTTRQRAPTMSSTAPGSGGIPSKYVGSRTYVEAGSQAKSSPSGTGSAAPGLVAREDVRVRRAEHLLADRSGDRLAHLLGRRPDVRRGRRPRRPTRRRSAPSRGRCPSVPASA